MVINLSNNIYCKYHNVKNNKARLQHEYQFYDNNNLFYKRLINKSEGNIDLKNNTIIMVDKFDANIKINFKKLKIVLMLHRINRKGYGNINLDIFGNIQNNYINLNYKKQINTKNNFININENKELIYVNNNKINTNENNINNNLDEINTNENNIGDINNKLNNLNLSDGYIIKIIFMYNFEILKDCILKYDLNLQVFSYEIKSDFKEDDFLHISCYTFLNIIDIPISILYLIDMFYMIKINLYKRYIFYTKTQEMIK